MKGSCGNVLGSLEEANLPCRTLPSSNPIPGAELVADLKMGIGNSTDAKIGAFRHCRLFNDESASLGVMVTLERLSRQKCRSHMVLWFRRLRTWIYEDTELSEHQRAGGTWLR